jgi:hypothetical protein
VSKEKSNKWPNEEKNVPTNKNAHAAQHDQEHDRAHAGVRIHGKEAQEHDQSGHEHTDDNRTAAAEKVGNVSDNDTAGHHPHRVQSGDQIGRNRIEGFAQEIRQPKEKYVVRQLRIIKPKIEMIEITKQRM